MRLNESGSFHGAGAKFIPFHSDFGGRMLMNTDELNFSRVAAASAAKEKVILLMAF